MSAVKHVKGSERMSSMNGSKKIGIMGPFGFGNLGDAAIQEAMLQHVREHVPNAQIYGFSLNPEDTEERHGIPSYPIGRMAKDGWRIPGEAADATFLERLMVRFRTHNSAIVRKFGRIFFAMPAEFVGLARASRILKGFDMFIVSGGGQLDDYWGGPFHHPYTLFVWSLLARRHKVPFYIVSVGAGPLNAPLSRLFDKWALSLATYRSYRDADSKRFVKNVLGFDRNDPVYPDLAHSIKVNVPTSKPHSDKPIIGLGPMTYFDPRVWPESDSAIYSNYLSKLADFTTWLIDEGYKIVFFTGEAVHDRWTVDDLRQLLDERGVKPTAGQIIDEPIDTVEQLLSQLVKTDIVIASRFHGVLLSLRLYKPVLALSYHKKINELMADTGQSSYCLSIADFQVEALKERFKALEANRMEANAQITQRIQTYQAALDEQYTTIFANRQD
jgi:polysaccharide pyruvyl transferase WcaK-like protein